MSSIIQKSQLEDTLRIDAEYYQPEYLEIAAKLPRAVSKSLNSLASIMTQGPNPVFAESGKCCLNGRNVKNNRICTENSDYVSADEFNRLKRFRVEKNDILITLKGAGSIGKTGFVFDDSKDCIFSRNVGLIRLQDQKIAKFLYAFLLSSYGSSQVDRGITGGTGQLTLPVSAIKRIRVPIFEQKFIEFVDSLICESETRYKKSERDYSRAEKLLLEELGLADFQDQDELSYVVNYDDLDEAGRIDADYFQPKYEKLISQLEQHNCKTLNEVVTMQKGIEVGAAEYREEGRLFIRVSSLSRQGINKQDQKHISQELYIKLQKTYQPQVGEILLTKDATPGIAYVVKESVEGIVAGGILRLIARNGINPEYLALCINSLIGQLQAKRDGGGSIIAHWRPDQIKNLLVPVLPKATQNEIANLIFDSHTARKKSRELLDQAKREVEEMIEKTAA